MNNNEKVENYFKDKTELEINKDDLEESKIELGNDTSKVNLLE